VLCKDAKLDFIAGDVEKSGVWVKDLSEDRMREGIETGTGDVDERKGYWEEGDSDLHGAGGQTISRTAPSNK